MNGPSCSAHSYPDMRSTSLVKQRRTLPTLLFALVLIMGFGFVSPVSAQTTLSPSTLSFGNVAEGQSSTTKTATFKNTRTVVVTISGITISGGTGPSDFAWGGNCPISPATLGAGQKCRISVKFTPTALGSRTATLTVTHNACTSPQSVPL